MPTPNNQFNTSYYCWHVVVTPYNLPLEMCMKDPYLFLTCIIPCLDNLKPKIDVYLQPLITELNELLCNGVLIYDISTKHNFMQIQLTTSSKTHQIQGILHHRLGKNIKSE